MCTQIKYVRVSRNPWLFRREHNELYLLYTSHWSNYCGLYKLLEWRHNVKSINIQSQMSYD